MRDAAFTALVFAILALIVLDYVEAIETRLARLERKPAVILGGLWEKDSERGNRENPR